LEEFTVVLLLPTLVAEVLAVLELVAV